MSQPPPPPLARQRAVLHRGSANLRQTEGKRMESTLAARTYRPFRRGWTLTPCFSVAAYTSFAHTTDKSKKKNDLYANAGRTETNLSPKLTSQVRKSRRGGARSTRQTIKRQREIFPTPKPRARQTFVTPTTKTCSPFRTGGMTATPLFLGIFLGAA